MCVLALAVTTAYIESAHIAVSTNIAPSATHSRAEFPPGLANCGRNAAKKSAVLGLSSETTSPSLNTGPSLADASAPALAGPRAPSAARAPELRQAAPAV